MADTPEGGGSQADPLEQLRRLQRVTDVALSHLALEDLLDELLIRVSEALDADTAAVLLLDEPSNELVARAAKGIEEEVEQGVRIPIGKGFAGRIAAERQPVILDEVDHSNVMNPILLEKGIRSLLGVPLQVQSRLLGVLHVGTLHPRRFTPADVELLQLVADRVALAVHVGLYERERVVTETLQRTFLPERLPPVVGADLVARYIPASTSGVGGDWYDVFVLGDGCVAAAVGDVVGRGIPAASVMGRLRNSLRAYAIEPTPPEVVVRRLNTMLRTFDLEEMATLVYAVIDVQGGTVTVVNAGHLPPALSIPGAGTRFLETPPVAPLGARQHLDAQPYTFDIPTGATLLLYTDGLVERRGADLTDLLESLLGAIDPSMKLEALADTILQRVSDDEPTDDVALLGIRLQPSVSAPYSISVPALPAELARVRRMVRAWLTEQQIPERIGYDVLVGTGEACANAIEHAYAVQRGELHLVLERTPSSVRATVTDRGRWRSARGSNRGRGLPMMRKLASAVDVTTTDEGTSVHLSFSLDRAVEAS